jgi:hypothetical protein
MPVARAAASTLRCVSRATIASSLFRVNFEPGVAIRYQSLPFSREIADRQA